MHVQRERPARQLQDSQANGAPGTITNNLSAESTFYFGEQVGFPGWPGSIVEPDPIETDRMTIMSFEKEKI